MGREQRQNKTTKQNKNGVVSCEQRQNKTYTKNGLVSREHTKQTKKTKK